MSTIIRASASIRQNYGEISKLCKDTQEPVYLTKNGDGDLVVMDIVAFDQRVKQLELREKLLEIEEGRRMGGADFSARDISRELRHRLEKRNVQS